MRYLVGIAMAFVVAATAALAAGRADPVTFAAVDPSASGTQVTIELRSVADATVVQSLGTFPVVSRTRPTLTDNGFAYAPTGATST